jgi:hypothetical protein
MHSFTINIQRTTFAKEYEYKRAKKLLPTEAISQSEHDIAEGEFFDAKGAHEQAIGELKFEKLLLENCEIRAKQDCYVTKILNFPGSWTNVGYPVAEVMLITPMLVDVKMSRQNAKKVVNGDLPVQIFVEGYDKPLSAFVQYIQLTKEGVSIPVDNYFYPIKDKDVPVVNNYAYVLRFDRERDSKLGVPVYCIHIDSKGYYVWKAVGQKFMGPKPIPDKFKVEKTYFKPGNEARMAGPIGRILTVTSEALNIYDVILKDIPKDLKDGDTVGYQKKQLLFWPGDEVKITIPELNE